MTIDRARWMVRLSMLLVGTLVVVGPVSRAVGQAIDPPRATVTGVVFDDRNGNGERDRGEPGVAGVSVSDGVSIVATDADGRYRMEIDPQRRTTDLVFITQPAGYAVPTDEYMTPRFYRALGEVSDGDEVSADFALRLDPRSRSANFSFANVADPHINPQLPDQIRQINAAAHDLAFIQVSGDLTNSATDAQFAQYLAATAGSALPVWPAVGNHEYFTGGGTGYADRIDNYRRHVGPEWYSFDYGDRHFLVLENNGQAPFDEQLAWVRRDLELNATGKRLVVLTHQPMNVPFGSPSQYDAYGELLERYGAELVLVGHEHSNDVEPDSTWVPGARHVQTNSSSYTIDSSPRGFRFVHMRGDRFENPFRMYGMERLLTITDPAPGTQIPTFTGVQVNAYDTGDEVRRVRYRLDGGAWRPMRSTGELTWHAERLRPPVAPGVHTLDVEATGTSGERWAATATFTLTTEDPVPPTAGADWAQHHGDPAHSGVAADSLGPALRLAWSYRTPATFLTGSPVIADGVVYAGTRDENGEGASAVHAVDLATGAQVWQRAIPSSVHGTLAVDGGRVFVPSVRGTLFALDAADGSLLWQRDPEPAEPPNNQRAYSYYAPTVADGRVYWAYQTRFGPASQGLLTALDPATGEPVWESPMAGATMSDGTPAVAGGRVFVGNQSSDRVLAYDAEDGGRLWDSAAVLGGWQDGVPTATEDTVYIGANNGITARDTVTGDVRWSYRSPYPSHVSSGSTPSAAAVAGGVVYMGFPSGAVTALDATTGAVRWDRLLPGDTYLGGIHSSPVVSGDTVFVGANNGRLYALDRATGQPRWEYETGSWVAAGPAVSGNTLVAGAWDGNLYAFTPGGEAAPPLATVSGTVTEASSGAAIPAIRVTAIRDGADPVVTSTDGEGRYVLGLEPGTYTILATMLGYSVATETVEVTEGSGAEANLELEPVTVSASAGKTLTGAQAEAGLEDVVIENQLLAMAVSRVFDDPQLPGATVGKPVDMAVSGRDDQLDWLNLPYVATEPPEGTEAWQQIAVVNTEVEIVQSAGEQAVVRVTGGSAAHPDLRVVTTYTIRADQPWVTAETEFVNGGDTAVSLWVGDVIDHDGAGQYSGVAGHGAITTPYPDPRPYQPAGPWIGMAGSDPQTYGLIYAPGTPPWTAYGTGNWIMSQVGVSVAAGDAYTLTRRIVAAPSPAPDPFAVLDDLVAGE